MHFFGTLGILVSFLGGLVTTYLIAQKIYCLAADLPVREVTEQPLFYLGLVSVIIGVQLFLAGFVAELVSRTASERNTYHIDKEI